MDKLLELLGLVAKESKEEAKKLADAVRAKISELDAEIGKQESMKNDAIKTRDEAKAKLRDAGVKLGVDFSSDSVDADIEKIKRGDNSANEVKDKEIQQLKGEVVKVKETLELERKQNEEKVLAIALEKDIATTLTKYNAKKNATGYIIDAVKKNAVFKDGKLTFKNEDGTTLRVNGSDAGLDDVIKGMAEKEKEAKESMFFDVSVQESGAGNGAGGGVGSANAGGVKF